MFAATRDGAATERPDAATLHFEARRRRAPLIGDLLLAAARAVAPSSSRVARLTDARGEPVDSRSTGYTNRIGADVLDVSPGVAVAKRQRRIGGPSVVRARGIRIRVRRRPRMRRHRPHRLRHCGSSHSTAGTCRCGPTAQRIVRGGRAGRAGSLTPSSDSWSRRCSTAGQTSRSRRSTMLLTRKARARRRSPSAFSHSWAERRLHLDRVGTGGRVSQGNPQGRLRRRDDDRLCVRCSRTRRAQQPRGSRRNVRQGEPRPATANEARCDAPRTPFDSRRNARLPRDRDSGTLGAYQEPWGSRDGPGARSTKRGRRLPPRQGCNRLAVRSREPRHRRRCSSPTSATCRRRWRSAPTICCSPTRAACHLKRGSPQCCSCAAVCGAREGADGSERVDFAYYDREAGAHVIRTRNRRIDRRARHHTRKPQPPWPERSTCDGTDRCRHPATRRWISRTHIFRRLHDFRLARTREALARRCCLRQHPLREHGDRRVGARQAHALRAPDGNGDPHLGLRLGGEASAARTVARPRPCARGCFARCDRRRHHAVSRCGARDQIALDAEGVDCHWASTSSSRRCCSAEARRGPRRPADTAACA